MLDASGATKVGFAIGCGGRGTRVSRWRLIAAPSATGYVCAGGAIALNTGGSAGATGGIMRRSMSGAGCGAGVGAAGRTATTRRTRAGGGSGRRRASTGRRPRSWARMSRPAPRSSPSSTPRVHTLPYCQQPLTVPAQPPQSRWPPAPDQAAEGRGARRVDRPLGQAAWRRLRRRHREPDQLEHSDQVAQVRTALHLSLPIVSVPADGPRSTSFAVTSTTISTPRARSRSARPY